MSQVNRSAMRVRPRQPYIDWANANLEDGGEAVSTEDFEDASIYLLPVFESDEDAEEIVQEVHDLVFALELGAWSDDETIWPQDRSFAMFLDWFQVEPGSLVVDLADAELVVDGDSE